MANPGMPRQSNNFQGDVCRCAASWVTNALHTTICDTIRAARPTAGGLCISRFFCAQGCKTGAKWSTRPVYGDSAAEASGCSNLRSDVLLLEFEPTYDAWRAPPARPASWVSKTLREGAAPHRPRYRVVAGDAHRDPARLLLLYESRALHARAWANGIPTGGPNYCRSLLSFCFRYFSSNPEPSFLARAPCWAASSRRMKISTDTPAGASQAGYHLNSRCSTCPRPLPPDRVGPLRLGARLCLDHGINYRNMAGNAGSTRRSAARLIIAITWSLDGGRTPTD